MRKRILQAEGLASGRALGSLFSKRYFSISTSQALFWAMGTGQWTRLTRPLTSLAPRWLQVLGS